MNCNLLKKFTVFFMSFGMMHCAHHDDAQQVFGEVSESVKTVEDSDEVANKPGKYLGQEVSVDGSIERVLADHAFVLDLDGFFGRDQVLVINNTGYRLPVNEGDNVEVAGPLRVFVTSDIEEEVNYNLLESVSIEYKNTPVIVAKRVTGFWAENRPMETYKTQTKTAAEEQTTQPEGEYFEACNLTMYYKTDNAVGNPCAETEQFARQILSPEQFNRFQALLDKAGQSVAH